MSKFSHDPVILPSLPSYEGIGSVVYFDVNGKSLERLEVLLALAGPMYEGYMISVKDNRIVLFSYMGDSETNDPRVSKFMTPQPASVVAAQCYEWLKLAEYGREPDHDGSNSKGYRVKVDDIWGHVYMDKPEEGKYANTSWAACCAVEPFWLQYGK